MKPDAVARAERLLGSAAESWTRVQTRGYAQNEHWTVALANGIAGFFASHAGLPPPVTAPEVRGFQLAQLEVALPWACRVHGLPEP